MASVIAADNAHVSPCLVLTLRLASSKHYESQTCTPNNTSPLVLCNIYWRLPAPRQRPTGQFQFKEDRSEECKPGFKYVDPYIWKAMIMMKWTLNEHCKNDTKAGAKTFQQNDKRRQREQNIEGRLRGFNRFFHVPMSLLFPFTVSANRFQLWHRHLVSLACTKTTAWTRHCYNCLDISCLTNQQLLYV